MYRPMTKYYILSNQQKMYSGLNRLRHVHICIHKDKHTLTHTQTQTQTHTHTHTHTHTELPTPISLHSTTQGLS